MRIALIDDNLVYLDKLVADLTLYFTEKEIDFTITKFADSEAFATSFNRGDFDFIFLDILMPKMNGLDLATQIRTLDHTCHLIFLTSSTDFAIECYQFAASGYVIKDTCTDKLYATLNHCLSQQFLDNLKLYITVDRQPIAIHFHNIISVESQLRRTIIYTPTLTLSTTSNFNEICSQLSFNPSFLLCFRGCLVNLNYVTQMTEEGFLMSDNRLVPISRRNRSRIRSIYMDFTL